MSAKECSVILIHGVGGHREGWSGPFQKALEDELEADWERIVIFDALWGPLSERLFPDLSPAEPTAAGLGVGLDLRAAFYHFAWLLAARMIVADADASSASHTLDPLAMWEATSTDSSAESMPQPVIDVANYLACNSVRVGVQNVLHEKLRDARERNPTSPIVIASHSQGSVISYDVLRLTGTSYPLVRTWITMGSPLCKYLRIGWGGDPIGMPQGVRWLNLYDVRDNVGRKLKDAVTWQPPYLRPIDEEVHNGEKPHNHWGSPAVVTHIANEIREVLPR